MRQSSGIIILGHGSKKVEWKRPFLKLESKINQKGGGLIAKSAFMEKSEPTLLQSVKTIVEADIEKILIVPIFIAAGSHVFDDFPKLAQKLEQTYPKITFTWTPPIGEWDSLLDAMVDIIIKQV